MRNARIVHRSFALALAAFPAVCLFPAEANAQNAPGRVQRLANSDVEISLTAGQHAPRLDAIQQVSGTILRNSIPEALPASIEIGGKTAPIAWKLQKTVKTTDRRRLELVYESQNPHLRLTWVWESRAAFGAMEHFITVQNLTSQAIWLPLIDSLRLQFACPPTRKIQHFYVEKGADTPSPVGTHLVDVADGYKWTGKSSTYAFPNPGEAREIIPAEFVFDQEGEQRGWFAGIEFSGRTRISLDRSGGTLRSILGLNPDPRPFRTRLDPGDSFTTPTVFLGAFSGGPDGASNELRPWVRAVLGNPLTWNDPHYPYTVNNSWGSGVQVDEPLALRMIAESKELGLEMFHLDAGWFRAVADWYPDPKKFPHGLAPIADAAHRAGLRFGLWVDWTQAGLSTNPGAFNVHDPTIKDWLITDLPPNWKPEEYKGQTVDIGVPAAKETFGREVKRIIEDYHLDMLEHDGYLVTQGCVRDDHPHAPPDRSTMKIVHDWASDFVIASNSTDVSYHSVRAYYDIYQQARREHPGLIFEICNDGGRMVDFGSAAHGDYFSITDTYDPLSNRRAFYDTSTMLPPAMLESYVEKWPAPQLWNFRYMLRSGMMGWVSIMTDTNAWSPEQHEAARQAIALYKEKLRPLIRDARLYHISARPDGVHWDAVQYWDPARKSGVVYAFRGSVPDEPRHTFHLSGLDPAKRYRLNFEDKTAPVRTVSGSELLHTGLQVDLEHPLSSELIFVEEDESSR